MLPRSFRLWAGLAAVHLVVVVLSGTRLVPETGPWSPVRFYSTLSGADGFFGFFAPNIGSQLDVKFEAVSETGKRIQGKLLTGNPEADLRIGNLIAAFWAEPVDKTLKRALAASWAGKIFARHPEAREVRFRVSALALPSREEFRRGARAEWRTYYRSTFERPVEGE